MRLSSGISSFVLLMLLLAAQPLAYGQKKKKNKEDEKKEVTKYERANAEYLLIDAQKYLLLEDYEKAEAFLRQSLDVDPKNHAAHFKLAELYFTTNETDKGLDEITAALNLVKGNKYYYLLAARLYKQKNDLRSVAKSYEDMIANTNDYHDYLLDLADTYSALNEPEKAISTIEILESKFGKNGRFTLQKVSLLISSGREADAIDLVKELIDSGVDDESFVLEYANLVSTHRSVQEAIDFLEPRERTGKLDLFLVQLYIGINATDKAIRLMKDSFVDPNLPIENKLTMVNDLLSQKDFREYGSTIISLQNSLEQIHPDNALVLEMSGRLYGELARVNPEMRSEYRRKEIESLIKVKDLNPSDFQVWNRILSAEYENESWNELAEHSNEALDFYPNQGLFYFYNGAASLKLGQLEEASTSLNQGSKLAFSNPLLKSRIDGKYAEVLLAEGDLNAALQKFQQILHSENVHPEVLNTYSFQLALRELDLTKALDISKQLIGIDPTSYSSIYTRGFVLFKAKEFEEARSIIEGKIKDSESGITGKVLELYGDVLFKLDLTELALEQWQKAKSLGGTSDKIDQKIETKQYY